jgi:predicted  nucleic acid-binding Zn-ribbon protein
MEFPMRILALVAVALLFVAAGSQLYALQQHQSISLLHLLLTQPLPQQAAWIVALAAPVLLLFATLWGHERMLQQRKLSDGLSAQMRRMREEIGDLRTAQKDNEDAVSYLTRSDPETGIADLQRRLSAAEQALDHHHSRNEAADLLASIEQVREQQKGMRERLGGVIAKRTSLESVLAELHRFQDEAEQAMARMEEDKNGDTLDTRLRKFVEFGRDAQFRCDGIEGSLHGILQQEKEFAEVRARLAPLVDVESGVRKRLRVLQELRAELAGNLEAVERDGGIPLGDRVKELGESRSGLEQRISEVKLRCEEIERALQAMIQHQKEFDAIKTRLAPLLDTQNGVRTRLRILQDTRAELVSSLEGVERDGGVPLPERVQQLSETRSGLEQRVSALLDQVQKIETVQKEISALFAKLNQAHRVSRDTDGSIRIVSQTG